MSKFAYEVRDPKGVVLRGEAVGPSHLDVVLELKKVGYEVLGVWQKPPYLPGTSIWRFFHRASIEELSLFTRQLSLYFSSGVGLLRGLESIAGQGFSKTITDSAKEVADGLKNGRGLAESMSMRPTVFSQVYVRLVHAGESSGALEKILIRLADFLERDLLLQKRLRSALAYPALVFALSLSVVAFLMLFIFPMFISFFDGLDVEMPRLTQSLIQISGFFSNPVVLGIGLGVLPFVLYQAYDRLGRTDEAMTWLSGVRLRIPLAGPLFRQVLLARFSRTLAILLEAGIPQLTALSAAGKAIGNRSMEQAVERAMTRIKDEGKSLAAGLSEEKAFPRLLVSMLSVGEEVGQLPRVLDLASDSFDLEIDTSVSRLTVIIEPVMLGFMGIAVGYILLAVFLPVYSLVDKL